MPNIYLTVDTEIWPKHWDLSHKNFPKYYDQYIRGVTRTGEYGLPFQLRILKEHNLKAVFFVEPLFAYHYGLSPLRDIVAMIQEYGQSVELHIHTEWIGRTERTIPPGRFHLNLKDYSKQEQQQVISAGLENLLECGANNITAFRAGNFGANIDTLDALKNNGIFIDSSYNFTSPLGPCLDKIIFQPVVLEDVTEYPITVFKDGLGRFRHLQIGAASYNEMADVLEQAYHLDLNTAVLLWHSAEFMNKNKNRADPIAIRRFTKLCNFLARHNSRFETCHFQKQIVSSADATYGNDNKLNASGIHTCLRYSEQILRRLWGS